MARNMGNSNRFALVSMVVCLVLVVLLVSHSTNTTHAQETKVNLRLLFERLYEQIQANDGFMIVIKFRTPLVEGEDVWIIPDTRSADPNDEISIHISEIGDDFICFDAVRGSARYIECTPYSNIVVVRHFVD